jgi:phage/plasmid-like protein (TIGR03299 family)
MKMETAGSLDDGRHIFALASIQESFELTGGNGKDKVDGYLLFSSPNICGKSMNILFTPIRVVCNNTLTAALSAANGRGQFRMHHAREFCADEAKLALGLAKGQLEEFRAEAQFLAERRVTEEKLREYFSRIWPSGKEPTAANDNGMTRTAEAAMTIFHTQPGADLHPDSWWNAFNTVTYIVDHVRGRSDNNRLRQAWFGNGKQVKNKALALATDYARAA